MSAVDPSASPFQVWQRFTDMGRRAVFVGRRSVAFERTTGLARTTVGEVQWFYAGAVFLVAAGATFGWSFLNAFQYDRNVASSAYAFRGAADTQDSSALKESGEQPKRGNAPPALIRPQQQKQPVVTGATRTASPRRLEKTRFAARARAARAEPVALSEGDTNARASSKNADEAAAETVASTAKVQPGLRETAQLMVPPRETAAQPAVVQQTQERTNTEQLSPVQTADPSLAKPSARPLDRESSILVPPQPLRKVMPDARLVARTISSPIQVRIVLEIDATGHVTAAHMANGEMPRSALAQAALQAARQWIFQPATLRGQTIACQHQIVFEFSGTQR